MPDLYRMMRPVLFSLKPESARSIAFFSIRSGLDRLLLDKSASEPDPLILNQRIRGIDFPNPVGLAAGFDKDAEIFDRILWGFGFTEIGTVTPLPQPGNFRPRVFRLEADEAIINRMGFNSAGLDLVVQRLAARRGRPGIVGLNLGCNRDSKDAGADYEAGVRRAGRLAHYLVVNISSPNTPGLRDLQRRAALTELLERLCRARDEDAAGMPLLLKIAPDLGPGEREDIAEVALASGIDGLVIANTTVARPPGLHSRAAREGGGLSGRPLMRSSTALLAEMYRLTGGKMPLIGVGGIASATDAYAKIRAGASLVQLHTALIFSGPALVQRIKNGLAASLRRDGFSTITEAVGIDSGRNSSCQPVERSPARAGLSRREVRNEEALTTATRSGHSRRMSAGRAC